MSAVSVISGTEAMRSFGGSGICVGKGVSVSDCVCVSVAMILTFESFLVDSRPASAVYKWKFRFIYFCQLSSSVNLVKKNEKKTYACVRRLCIQYFCNPFMVTVAGRLKR